MREKRGGRDLSATFFASSGWEFPVSSLIEFEVIAAGAVCVEWGAIRGDIEMSLWC